MARDLTEDEIDYCTSATCKYILNQAVKKQYIKTSDITKHCLKGEQRHYETVFQNAKSLLSEVRNLFYFFIWNFHSYFIHIENCT